ncbi:hypothetical protein LSTR_LSTR009126 [Laodelphax striatellus]|uniref:Uncharacterized protein n=1 Tax=Laodelphax striatellus TaxID=195883 RepID=A0A482XNP6_LAOST|nr:hypothetical protein LSTR_LSTR009126 [Laodelphax striatellus]
MPTGCRLRSGLRMRVSRPKFKGGDGSNVFHVAVSIETSVVYWTPLSALVQCCVVLVVGICPRFPRLKIEWKILEPGMADCTRNEKIDERWVEWWGGVEDAANE